MGVLWEYLEKNGRMVDVYTDRDSMFAIPRREGETQQERVAEDRLTQIGRGLRELGIGWIAAYSPQAKGRISRHAVWSRHQSVTGRLRGRSSCSDIGRCWLQRTFARLRYGRGRG